MPQIFASLAIANILLIVASGAAGLLAGSWGADRHILLAVLTLLFSCFVQVVAFTYLTVTGKMIAQAVHLARLDAAALAQSKSNKRGLTRCLALVLVVVVLVTATGASGWRAGGATLWHDAAAGLLVLVHLGVFLREYEIVFQNARLLDRTLQEYESIRRKRE